MNENDIGSRSSGWLMHHKLRPPRLRVNLIHRSRLIEKLEKGAQGRVTLVHGPAGYGKTTLLTQWHDILQTAERGVVWLSFDEEDNDPFLLLSHLSFGLSDAVPKLRNITLSNSARPNLKIIQMALSRIIHELEAADPLVIILDDYHMIHAQTIHDLVLYLIKAIPDHIHIVLASRIRNLIPVSALMVHGQVEEITPDDLRFGMDEVSIIFGQDLSLTSMQRLLDRTEGWPVAIQLARNWTQGLDLADKLIDQFSGAAGDVSLYLTEQIMSQLAPDIQQFLVRTAIVDRINGDLSNAICERRDGWEVLENLERLSAVLIPLDQNKDWFRYHHLFLDYLRNRQKTLGEEKLRQLHIIASSWFLSHNQFDRAVKHAALSGDYTLAGQLVIDAGGVWIAIRHGAARLQRLMDHLPTTVIDNHVQLRAARTFLWLKDGLFRQAQMDLEEIKTLVAACPQPSDEMQADILAVRLMLAELGDDGVALEDVSALEALLGNLLKTTRWLQGAVNELICMAHIRRGNAILAQAAGQEALRIYEEFEALNGRVFSRIHLGLVSLLQGQLSKATTTLESAEKLARDYMSPDSSTLAITQILLAQLAYERNDLQAASRLCDAALEQIENGESWFEIYQIGYYLATALMLAEDRIPEALDFLKRAEATSSRRGLTRLKNVVYYRRIEILTFTNTDEHEALDLDNLIQDFNKKEQGFTFLELELAVFALARLAIVCDSPAIATDILDRLQQKAEERGRHRTVIKILILRSLAAGKLNDVDQAAACLRRAITMAAAEGCRRIFIEEGNALIALMDETLKHIRISNLAPDAVALIADIFSAHIDPDGSHAEDPSQILKPRERQVMTGLAEGLSNKVIARQLDLTDDAIKYHLKKIYAKLGVSDRNMAVIVARKYGILP